METADISKQFEQILSELKEIEDLTDDSIVQVAQVILQESGKDRRAALANKAKSSNNGYFTRSQSSENGDNQPATERQKNALSNFKIPYSEDITKIEASVLLDEAFEKLERNKKGSRKTPFILKNRGSHKVLLNDSKDVMEIEEFSYISKDLREILGNELANEVEGYLQTYPFPIQESLYYK